jgi:hypothetical protein
MSAAIYVYVVVWALIVWLIVGIWRVRRRSVTPGTALLSSMDLLFDDNRRAAIEVIVEERAGERDPEDEDGDLPQLESPPEAFSPDELAERSHRR